MKIAILLLAFFVSSPICFGKEIEDLRTRNEVETEVRALFIQEDVSKLNALEKYLIKESSVSLSGYPLLDFFYDGLKNYFKSQSGDEKLWSIVEKRVHDWTKRTPDSAASHLAVAQMLRAKAWSIRGEGLANTVSEKQWTEFRKYLGQQRSYLLQNATVASADPEWYNQMLLANNELGLPRAEYDRLMGEGLKKFPTYIRLYVTGAMKSTPQWGGSVEAIEEFLNESTATVKKDMGDQLYSHAYLALLQSGAIDIRKAKFDCDRLVLGADRVATSFPTPYNFSNAAYAAAVCNNRELARRYVALLGENPINLSIWGTDAAEASSNYARMLEWLK